jgi:hypothetical protein
MANELIDEIEMEVFGVPTLFITVATAEEKDGG